MWNHKQEKILRTEVEKRFRDRTPARDVIDADWHSRVSRTEIRAIAWNQFAVIPPEMDREWAAKFARWYLAMAKRALRELDPDWKETLKRNPPFPYWTRKE
jgi:hypothetical protein